jgi:hypothetical protein
VSVLLVSARQAASERLSSSSRREACRSDASSSRLLPAILERLLTASLDATIDWEAPSVSKCSLPTVSQPSVAAQVRAGQQPGD